MTRRGAILGWLIAAVMVVVFSIYIMWCGGCVVAFTIPVSDLWGGERVQVTKMPRDYCNGKDGGHD